MHNAYAWRMHGGSIDGGPTGDGESCPSGPIIFGQRPPAYPCRLAVSSAIGKMRW